MLSWQRPQELLLLVIIDAMDIDLTDEQNRRFVYTISYWFVNVSVMLEQGLQAFFLHHHFFELSGFDGD